MRYLNCVFVAVSLLLSGMALTSCGNDEPAAVQEVYVPAGMSTDVEIKPWGSVVANAIVFNSTGEWASEIYATGSSFAIPDAPRGMMWTGLRCCLSKAAPERSRHRCMPLPTMPLTQGMRS